MDSAVKDKVLLILRRCWRWIDKNSAVLVLILALTTFTSAIIGVSTSRASPDAEPAPNSNWFNSLTDKLYESAQALLLNMEPHREEFNLWIGIARIAAVLLIVLVATQAIGQLFRESLANMRLRFGGTRNVFIGGLGRIGYQLAKDYANQGKLLVVMEIAEPNFWTMSAEDAGAIVIEGDVTDLNSLREHIFRDPQTIHLVTGNDLSNINALANVRSLRREFLARYGKPLGPVDCYVHIDDPGLQQTLDRCLMESTSGQDHSLNVHLFNIYHETACQLIIDQLTPLRPRERNEVALYIIFGFNQMGSAMVKELAEFAHFENQKRSRILVLTSDAESACRDCLAKWSRLSPNFVHQSLDSLSFDSRCDEWTSQVARPQIVENQNVDPRAVEYVANVHFCQMQSDEFLSQGEVDQLVRLATETGVRPVILFCFEEDEKNFRLASDLHHMLQSFHGINCEFGPTGEIAEADRLMHQRHREFHLPIFAFLPRSQPLREILSESTEKYPLRAFGAVHEGLSRAHDDAVEQIAMDIAWDYDCSTQQLQQANFPRSEYNQFWRKKKFWDRHSNLTAAEHAWIKVQMLGYRFAAVGSKGHSLSSKEHVRSSRSLELEAISQEQRALIALVEHNRWMAERLLVGWSYGPRSEQPPCRLSICSKQDLDQTELVKDFEQIMAVLRFVKNRGYDC